MSSTNRGAERDPLDDYPSPRWTVHRLLDARVVPIGGIWYEPCAGAGNIIRAVAEWCDLHDPTGEQIERPRWIANELNPKYLPALRALPRVELVTCEDAQELIVGPGCAVGISNPAFAPSAEILVRMLTGAPGALPVFLQRIGWCGGPRAELFRHLKPSLYPLPQRPSFKDVVSIDPKTGKARKSSQDSTEYGWWVFDGLGRFEVLGDTPDEVRAAEKAERRAAEKAAGLVWADGPCAGLPIERTPAGTINNCALANGFAVRECQLCGGRCPDGDKLEDRSCHLCGHPVDSHDVDGLCHADLCVCEAMG